MINFIFFTLQYKAILCIITLSLIKREKIEPIWRPTIFSPITHTRILHAHLYYTHTKRSCQENLPYFDCKYFTHISIY